MDDAPEKYDGSTPEKIFQSVCRTIKNGTPCAARIIQDVDRIKNETLQRIIDAKGTYIEDSSGKKARKGVRGEAEKEAKAERAIMTDPLLLEKFKEMIAKVRAREMKVPCNFDLTGDAAVEIVEETIYDFASVDPADDVDGWHEEAIESFDEEEAEE